MADTVNCNKVIKNCKYNCEIKGKYFYCDYLCITGKIRDCEPKKCDKYEKKNKKATKD